MIKVLNVISDTNIGGAGKCVLTYAQNYDKKKIDLKIVLPKGSLLKEKFDNIGVETIEINGNKDKSFDVKSINELKKIFKIEKPDIIHAHSSMSAKIAGRSLKKTKIIYTRHCVFPVPKKYEHKLVRNINRCIDNKFSDLIIAVAQAAKDNLIAEGIEEKKIEVVLNGVNPLKRLSQEQINEIKQRYNIGMDDKVIGIMARLEEVKGHSYYIDAAKEVIDKEGRNYKFLIIGTGSLENNLKEKVKEMNLDDNVIFTGFISNVEEILNILDLQVNCSYGTEATSLSLLEGMSLGIPAVVTRFGGNPGVIFDGENGLLVSIKDSSDIANGIINSLSDNKKYEDMCKKSKEIFEAKFLSKVYAKNIEKIYESLVK